MGNVTLLYTMTGVAMHYICLQQTNRAVDISTWATHPGLRQNLPPPANAATYKSMMPFPFGGYSFSRYRKKIIARSPQSRKTQLSMFLVRGIYPRMGWIQPVLI